MGDGRIFMKRDFRCLLYSAWDIGLMRSNILLSTALSRFSLWLQKCPVGKGLVTSGTCSFKARNPGSIRLGNNVRLLADWRTNRVGLTGPVILHTLGEGVIEIGDNSGGSSVVISSKSQVRIGKHVKLGGNVRIFDHDFHSLDSMVRRKGNDAEESNSLPVEIGDDVFVGTNAIILKGVKLRERCIVSAGAVVFRGDYPADSHLLGNPAVLKPKQTRFLG